MDGDDFARLHRERRFAAHMQAAETHDRAERVHLAFAGRFEEIRHADRADHERALASHEHEKAERARRTAWWELRRD